MKKKMFSMMAMFLIAGFILSACASEEAPPATVVITKEVGGETVTLIVTATPEVSAPPIVLDWNWGTEPPTADPALATDNVSIDVAGMLFMGLTNYDIDGSIIPWLAKDWFVSEDGLLWTFKLRDDVPWVRYNTGTTEVDFIYDEEGNQRFVNAYDVEYAVKRTLDPDTASNYAYVLYVIENAEAVNAGEEGVTLDDIGVRAVDDQTVEFELEFPAGFFPAVAGLWTAAPVPQWTIEEAEVQWTEPGTVVSNGPYVMTEWIHGSELNMMKNPYWPDADSVQIDQIHGVMIVEESTEFAMYENGELDSVGLPLAEVDRVKADPVLSEEYYNAPGTCTYFYGFANNKEPFDDVRVRKAFNMSIDKESIVENVTKGGQIPAGHLAVPGTFGAPEVGSVGLPYDPEGAKALLDEYLDEKGLEAADLDVVLMHNTGEGHQRIAQAIQQMWAVELGVDVSLENQEWAVFLDTIQNSTPLEDMPHVFRSGWCSDYPDENNWVYEVMHATAGANEQRRGCLDPTCNEVELQQFDLLTEQARSEQDPALRKDLYFEAERILVEEEAAYLPIYYYTTMQMTKPYLERDFQSLGHKHFYWWKIDQDAKLDTIQ
ncbi:MAG: hypothetical protein GTO18_04040 [Anaerolineales bacterium]|nr:hypothetical protein [Anaerolineales bacterium]